MRRRGGCETSEFVACGASNVDWSIVGNGAVKDRDVFVLFYFPAESTSVGEKTSVRGNDEVSS